MTDDALEALFGPETPPEPSPWAPSPEFLEFLRGLGYDSVQAFAQDGIDTLSEDPAYFDVVVDSAREARTNRQRGRSKK